MNDEYQNTLKEVYETVVNRPNGYQWQYGDYTFIKHDGFLSPRHSEVGLMNPNGNKVEAYTVALFDDWESFAGAVLELVEYGPDDLYDWLNRDE